MLNRWQLVSSFGIGSIVGSIVGALIQKKYEHKKLIFETKLLKYSALIAALQNAVVANYESESKLENARQSYVSAQKQVELIGTEEIISLSEKFYAPYCDFTNIRDSLVKVMQQDLKKYYN